MGDTVYNFWKKYIETSMLDRKDLVRVLKDRIDGLYASKNDETKDYAIMGLLQSYFDDLIEVMEFEAKKN